MELKIKSNHLQRKAFTLVELVVVLFVITCLGLTLVPALTRTATQSTAAGCRNNLRQLGSAWIMYAQDNAGRLVLNRDGASVGRYAGGESWVAGWLDASASNLDNTNTAMLVDHRTYPYGAYFGPYVRDPAFFHCPADHSKDPVRHLPRVRSYSMNNFLNGRDFDGYGRSQLSTKIEELSHPGQTYTILDEREDSINDGTFFVSLYPYQLVDYPAATHNAAGGFAFGDGHAETHRWLDPRTMPILRPGQVLGLNINIAGDSDVLWLQTHASSR